MDIKIAKELKKQEELTQNINVLKEDLKKLSDSKGKLEEAVQEFHGFEDVICKLVQDSEHISTTKDFMDKCDALSKKR